MRAISDTIARLTKFQGGRPVEVTSATRLAEFVGFGSNPGTLQAKFHVPKNLTANAALVIVLHGCTQNADDYDRGAGWSKLADREGFAVLYPEQARSNNANLCFNWFVPEDVTRDRGEVLSIAQMIGQIVTTRSLDPAKVFITGLSAGGAMTAAMLATYPELFAGGAIIGGLPYACATSVLEALDSMRGHGGPTDAQLVASVKKASGGFHGAWPTVSIWHGTADHTVSVSNLTRIGRQWRGIHGLDQEQCDVEHGKNWERRIWTGASGRKAVEEWSIKGMGHGVPIDLGANSIGTTAPYALPVGVSSTEQIARSWGLSHSEPLVAKTARTPPTKSRRPRTNISRIETTPVQQVIEGALRSAGLMQ